MIHLDDKKQQWFILTYIIFSCKIVILPAPPHQTPLPIEVEVKFFVQRGAVVNNDFGNGLTEK